MPDNGPLTPDNFMAKVEALLESTGVKVGAAQGAAITGAVLKAMEEHFKHFPVTPRAADLATRTLGQQLAENKGFLGQLSQAGVTGRFGNFGPIKLSHPVYDLKAGEMIRGGAIEQKDVTATQFPVPSTFLPFQPFPRRRLRIRDLLTVAGIGTPRVDYARVTGFSNTAGPQIGEGALKNLVDIATTLVTDNAKTMGDFMPVSRQAISDVAGLRAWVDSTLEYFLLLKEEDELLNGGAADDFAGLMTVTLASGNVQAQGTDSKLTAIRKAVTKVQTGFGSGANRSGFDPTGIILPPEEAEALDLLTDTSGRYLLAPLDTTAITTPVPTGRNIWGLTPVVSPAMPATRALVGAFDIGATYWIYEGLSIRVTDSHSDYFRRNLLAFLGEWRGMLSTYFPKAFCIVAFND